MSSKSKRGPLRRLFKPKKKVPLSSQVTSYGVDDSHSSNSDLIKRAPSTKQMKETKKKSNSRFGRKKNSKYASSSNKENRLNEVDVAEHDLPVSQSDLQAWKSGSVEAMPSPDTTAEYEPYFDFYGVTSHDVVQAKGDGSIQERINAVTTGGSEESTQTSSNNEESVKSSVADELQTRITTEAETAPEYNCTALRNVFSNFCTGEVQKSSMADDMGNTNIAKQFSVRVDVMENYDSQHDCSNDYKYAGGDHDVKRKDLMVTTRAALSRPFGRTSLPSDLAKKWVVQVSTNGYDQDKRMCSYNIMVHKEDVDSSFVTANIDRTLEDFVWLEEALQEEYHGSLILPLLSLTLTNGATWIDHTSSEEEFSLSEWDPVKISSDLVRDAIQSEDPIDAKLLENWLSDVLNSVRGKGEFILENKYENIINSESMESFLYMNSDPLPSPTLKLLKKSEFQNSKWSLDELKKALNFDDVGEDDLQSKLANLVKANLQCLGIVEDEEKISSGNLSSDDMNKSRQAKIQHEREQAEIWRSKIQSEEMRAQRFYINAQRENTLRAMYDLRTLLDREVLLSAAWKRLAISLSMIYASERDIEMTPIGEVSKTGKIGRTKVDDSLRILARQKVDRSVPSLKVLSGMLDAYYTDFCSVDPSLIQYAESSQRVLEMKSESTWKSQLKSFSPMNFINGNDNEMFLDHQRAEDHHFIMEKRLQMNEKNLSAALMQLCKVMKIRVSRMSWKYFKMESGQISLLLDSTSQLRSKLENNVSNEKARIEEIKADNEKEMQLVKLIMELGLKKKFVYKRYAQSLGSETSTLSEEDSETLTTDDGGLSHSPIMESLMNTLKQRTGRWNSEFSDLLVEASGMRNFEFDDKGLSKNVRMVSKVTTALRESVMRCLEALEMIDQVLKKSPKNDITMEDMRGNFLSRLATVFSCTCEQGQLDPEYEYIMARMRIDVNDSAGWLKKRSEHGESNCGVSAFRYHNLRHNECQDFIDRLKSRVNSYEILIEELESYVWMHRVADFVEKYYSNQRAIAVADWEKKTDITTAINIATKKRLTLLVVELKEKLELIGDSVSHTLVKQAKERHLGSKTLKVELEQLATRRFQRLKEFLSNNSLSIINEWVLQEERHANNELKCLQVVIEDIEQNIRRDENAIEADGGAHLFASKVTTSSRRSSQSSFLSKTSR